MNINAKDELVMKLLHYFVTDDNYEPVVLHGIDNEIWLQNLSPDAPYKIIRIVPKYLHNDEQFNMNLFFTKRILSQIKRRTWTLKLPTLSIYVDLGENVKIHSEPNLDNTEIISIKELSKDQTINKAFPNLMKRIKEINVKGFDLVEKLTKDINNATDNNSKRVEDVFTPKEPIITYLLMTINILIFIMMFGKGGATTESLIAFGANYKPLIQTGEYWRIIASAFLHVGLLHLAFNMYALYIIGPQLESYYGKLKFIIIYLGSAVGSSLLSLVFLNNNLSVGASGAIFGMLGAFVYFAYHYRIVLGDAVKRQIIPIIMLNLAIGFIIPGLDNAGHIGGLLAGLFLAMALGVKYRSTKSDIINGIILTLIYFTFVTYLVFMR